MSDAFRQQIEEQLSGKYLLGVDVGTNQTKGVLIDGKFRPVAEYATSHTMENPQPGYFEMDAEIWWAEFCEIAQGLLKKAAITPEQVACVGVSVMGCDCIPVDENDRPLRKAILYGIDARSGPQIEALLSEYGEETVRDMFGYIPNSSDIGTKILWIRDNEPEIYEHAHKFLTGSSYMCAKLTGQFVIDSYLAKASFRPIYTAEGTYNEQYGPLFCREDQMAACRDVTDVAGGITEAAALACGLKAGTPVITGTGDSTAESIAGGLVEPGTLFVQFGSTLFYIYCLDREMPAEVVDDYLLFPGSNPFTIPGSYAAGDGTNCAGTLTKWVRDVYYCKERDAEKEGGPNAYAVMAQEAAMVPAGSDGLIMLPYFYGERSPLYDAQARGVMFGLTGNHTRKEICRAALESVAYSVGSHIRIFRKVGLVPDRLVIAGGGTQNETWMQIVADVTGMPVQVSENWQTASYGDACMAAIGCGVLRDFHELSKVMPIGYIVEPNAEHQEIYERYLTIYEDLYRNTRDLMHQL